MFKAWATVVVAAIPCTVASAADVAHVQSNGTFNWSSASAWAAGIPAGAADRVVEPAGNTGTTLVVDAAATSTVAAWATYNNTSLTLEKPFAVTGRLDLREGTITDNGHNLTAGTLSNCSNANCYGVPSVGEGNGQTSVRGGGNYLTGEMIFVRASAVTLRPGDTTGTFTLGCLSYRNSCADANVTQEPSAYAGRLDQGLTITGSTFDVQTLGGGAGSALRGELTLNWNTSGLDGDNDWTLRWAGDRTTTLRSMLTSGALVIGTLPAGQTFNNNDNVYFDAATNYTYVGFQQTCPALHDEVPRASVVVCIQPGGVVAPNAILASRAAVSASSVVAPRAFLSAKARLIGTSSVGRRASIGAGALLTDSTVAADSIIGASADLAGTTVGFGTTIGTGVSAAPVTVVGSLVQVHPDVDLGASATIGRACQVGARTTAVEDLDLGADSLVGEDVTFGTNVHVGQGAVIGDDAVFGDDVRLGRDVTVRPGVSIGAHTIVRAGACVGASVPPNSLVERGDVSSCP
jgi:UDP-3-O-[3-hydroxymyristoyl] glucosamine N-acyltransferase